MKLTFTHKWIIENSKFYFQVLCFAHRKILTHQDNLIQPNHI